MIERSDLIRPFPVPVHDPAIELNPTIFTPVEESLKRLSAHQHCRRSCLLLFVIGGLQDNQHTVPFETKVCCNQILVLPHLVDYPLATLTVLFENIFVKPPLSIVGMERCAGFGLPTL